MSNTVIRVSKLGKLYRIGETLQRHDTLRDALVHTLRRTTHRAPRDSTQDTALWALRDISFEVKRGEVVGIIGRNGAGKSTLLKILSRITEPTTGEAEIHGRVGSLLEVGTGFHPELTGRENIYLNGAILGMRRAEIERRFDEIVAFSEVEKFLDTPVKRYSSGMYVRLAFAVAAHLEPEILMVDEVLAVGDVAFQRKCLGKMGDVARTGRTVLFVSHNMSAVQRLCTESLLLDTGRVVLKDDTRKVVDLYLSQEASVPPPGQWIDLTRASRTGSGRARFLRAQYSAPLEENLYRPSSGEPLDFWVEIASDTGRSVSSLAVTIYDMNGVKLVNADTLRRGREVTLRPGINGIQVRIRQLHLNEGTYTVGLWLANPGGDCFDHVAGAFRIQVGCAEENGFGVKPGSDGVVACDFDVTGPWPVCE